MSKKKRTQQRSKITVDPRQLEDNARIAPRTARRDGWVSALGGMGTIKDKRQYTSFQAVATNWRENIDLWRQDDLAGRIVELIPNEMMREGWELCVEGDNGPKIAKEVTSFLEDYYINDRVWQGLCLERAVGGSGIVMGTNDLRAMSEPLNLANTTSLEWLETFEPLELQARKWQNDPSQPDFGRPSTYNLQPVSPGGSKVSSVEVHRSRIAIFPGIVVSRRQITSQAGWGDAVLTRCRETLRDFQTTWAAAGALAADFAQPVWKIKGLADIIALDKGNELKVRIEMMELARSMVNAVVIDAELEDWDRKQTPITGLSDLMVQFATRLAASADVPVTRLMGMSPAGMNATGESDARNFYDGIGSQQERKITPPLSKIIRVAFRVLGYDEPDDWYIKYHPLWQPSEKEQADTRWTICQTDEKYIQNQVYSSDEVREFRFTGREYKSGMQVTGPAPEPPPAPAAAVDPDYQAVLAGAKQGALAPGQKPYKTDSDDETDDEEGLTEEEAERLFLEWASEQDDDERADEFNEEDHPRDEHGKFGSGGGGEKPAEPKVEKTPAHAALAKAARDSAKKAVEHAQTIRAALKKDPTNVKLQEASKKADALSKSARSSARKAEQAKNAKEAEKHTAAAKDKELEAAGHAGVAVHAKAVAPTPSSSKTAAQLKAETPAAKAAKILSDKANAASAIADSTLSSHPNVEELNKSAAKAHQEAAVASHAAGYHGTASNHEKAAKGHANFQAYKSPTPTKITDSKVISIPEFKSERAAFTDRLSAKEKSACLTYSTGAYRQINADLRAGKPNEITTHLDAALAKAPAPKEMVVHRGVGGDFAEKAFGALSTGDHFLEKGYSSTSAGGHAAFGGTIVHITVPKGSSAGPIPSHHPGENEYLLPRGTKYRVDKLERSKSNKLVAVHVTVVHD